MQGEVQIMFDQLYIPITFEEINVAISQLSNGKSGDTDKNIKCVFHTWQRQLIIYFTCYV